MRSKLMICLVILVMSGPTLAQPVLEISPDPLKFGFISVGGIQQRTLLFRNAGDQALILESCQIQAPFYINPLNGMTIGPNDSSQVTVFFSPDDEINYNFDIVVYSNAENPNYTLNTTGNGTRVYQPGEMIWSFQHIENVVCVAAGDDYNGDGIQEVVAESYDSGAEGDPLVCLSGSGNASPEVIWSVHPQGGPSNSGGYGDQCLARIDDLNGDGYDDIIRGTSWGGRTIFAIDGLTGNTIWAYNTYEHLPSGWIYSVAQLNDVTGDGVPEVLAGVGSDGDRTLCFNGSNGDLIWHYDADDAVSSVASLQDINSDGYDDAVFAAMDYGRMFYCVSGASSGIATPIWMFNIGESTFSLTTIKDINDDGYDDVIAGTWGRGLMAFSGHRAGQGVILWEIPISTYIMKVVSCPDVDGDGYDDIILASWSSYVEVYSGVDGSLIWRFFCGDDVWAVDYLEDITGDEIPEIIAGSFTHNVYVVDGARGQELWRFQAGAKPFSVRRISDVNGDGYDDVIAGTQYLDNAGGEVFVISGGQVDSVSIDDELPQILPQDYIVAANYPNPFNSTTIINFSLYQEGDFKVSIYDITGRLVDEKLGTGRPGKNKVIWDLSGENEIVSGIYIYTVEAGSKTGKGKMTFLK